MSSITSAIYGKNKSKSGLTPSVILINPKKPRNVGAVIRAASCFGVNQVWFTGNRVSLEPNSNYRLPREERMKGYKHVELRQFDYPFDEFKSDVTPVAIEIVPGAENLITFEHPEKAVYVFGPEDGGLESVTLRHCHRFVTIPSKHCINLAAAVYIVLYDRHLKRVTTTMENSFDIVENEARGFEDNEDLG